MPTAPSGPGKVCRLAWDYPAQGRSTFGLQPVFVNLSEAQVRQGYEVHVISRRNRDEPSEEEHNGVIVHRVSSPFSLGAIQRMKSLMKGSDDWVVHSHSTCGFFLAATRSFRRFPLVCHVHGTSRSHHVPIRYHEGGVVYDYKPITVTYNMLRERLLWTSGDRVLTVSNAIKQDITDYYGLTPEKVEVVYNGVDVTRFSKKTLSSVPRAIESLQGKSIILFVGHFGLRKGLAHLLSAMPLIKREVPEAHLLCIGGVPKWLGSEDYWGRLKADITRLGIEKDVTLLDAVPNLDLPWYYSAASVLALPSYYESFSKVTVEAMACELPVVATRAGGLLEVVDDGKTGLLVGYGDVEELSDAIVRVLEDHDAAGEMGRLGRQKAMRLFTWESVALRVQSVYESLEARSVNSARAQSAAIPRFSLDVKGDTP